MKIAYLDIETTSLKANEGFIVAIGVMNNGEPSLTFAGTLEEEKNALLWLRRELQGCDLVVTWYGSGFDIPFIIARALFHGVDLSVLAEIPMLDLCEWSKAHMLLSSYALKSVASFLGIEGGGEIRGSDIIFLFKRFKGGDQEAKHTILQHCRDDIVLLKKVHEKLKPLVERGGGSPRKNL